MKTENIIVLALVGIAAVLVLKASKGKAVATKAPVAPSAGGYYDGRYIPDLLNLQYDQGWGYGD